jgi:hypothetical protein
MARIQIPPGFTQPSQRLSHLDVYPTIRKNEVSLPLHLEKYWKVITSDLIRVSPPLFYPELLSLHDISPSLELSQ